MNQALDFQSVIMTLQKFWADQGCLIWQPYYTQIGAGTMNPGTFLRVLGPEPWRVAYVEPSVRPDDGRYGENPNRFQQHYQFQVILKPDPGNPQELYLKSLEALGIDPREHDIRFVEDNWQQPALGAWGLGWEVWMDGQEITQFTYFQQAGGLTLDPVAVEITYGLERITIPLQRVNHFRKVRWNNTRTYGDVNYQAEVEHSKYYFEVADVDRMRQLYKLYEQEAEEALKQGLVLPAHDYILKCSHTFNILDTRGAVGVTERQALFGRMRDMAHRISETYVAQRQKLEFPWLEESAQTITVAKPAQSVAPTVGPAPLLVEIGTEELPAADLQSALEQLKDRVPGMLDELRLAHGAVSVVGTPRRLVVMVDDLADRQQEKESLVKGPPASRAFDALGQPTPAAIGFAQSKGVQVSDLVTREIDGGSYVAALVQEKTRSAVEVLTEALSSLAAGIKFDKTMRWNATNVAFSRPVRWLLALYGAESIPFTFAGLTAGNVTHGLRFLEPESKAVHSLQEYRDFLSGQHILVDPELRKAAIREQSLAICRQVGAAELLDEGLMDEVNTLVEAPTAMLGKFDPSHLSLPPEVLISVMKKHQRYFPVFAPDGKLMPYFITIRNGDSQGMDVVTDGNEQVVRARFADANFFIQEDLKHSLEDLLGRLGTLTFQHKLGSMLDKSRRIEAVTAPLADELKLTDSEKEAALRAAKLCKADLVSHMVVEMTSLQGVMGRYYAVHSGEPPRVAQAIFEHYLPRFAGDHIPADKTGLVIGIADRLDSLVGLFAAGLAPTGTKDPFAQRRTALGLVQLLSENDLDFDLGKWMSVVEQGLPIPMTPADRKACFDFIVGRMRSSLTDAGYRYDVVEAVLAEQSNNPAGVYRAVRTLSEWVARPDWNTILPAFARCVRITRDQKVTYLVEESLFAEKAETELYQAVLKAEGNLPVKGELNDLLNVFAGMIPAVNHFFEEVLVMAEDANVRNNRLGLLQRLAALAKGTVDLSALEGF